MARGAALRSLKNADYTDRELMHILDGCANNEGWATTDDIMDALRISHPSGANATDEERAQYARQCIGTRFSWMVRYKYLERDEDRTKWRLTDTGHDLMNGKLTRTVEKALDKMKPGDRVLAIRMITDGFVRTNPGSIMMRREWEHNTARRNGRR